MDKANNCRSQKFLATAILCFLFTFTIVNNSRADWKALFYDDFESGDLSKWTITIEPDSPTPAGWEIMGESENNVLRGRGHSWAELTNKYWRNYSLTFRLKIITGQIHVCVKLGDQGRYLIRFANNSVTIEKESPWGTFTFLRSSSPTLNLNEWYGVEIRIISESIEVYLNNDKILTAEDAEYLVSGGIGFETLGEANEWTSEVLIDDVGVIGEAGGSISGVVTSEGKPVSGIPVQAFSDPCQYSLITQSRTDSLGKYTLEDLPADRTYVISLRYTHYAIIDIFSLDSKKKWL